MRNPLRSLLAWKAKREQDKSRPVITSEERVRAAHERAEALEQKSRVEEGGIPNEPVSEHSVDSDGNKSSAFEKFPARQRLAIRGFALAVGVWIIVEVLVLGTILEPHFSGRNVSFEESPITFLFALGMGFVIVGWAISPLLRAVMSKITGIPSEPVPAHPVEEPPQAPDIARDGKVVQVPFEFRGSAPEYFRIWIVNILLTILTLGIYSAWAKVRKRKYFYRNTYLQGDAFDYHADPIKILKGRLIAAPVLGLYLGIGYLFPGSEGLLLLIFGPIIPWLIVRSQIFNTRNTSYRNIRFSFVPNYRDAYGMFFGYGILTSVTFGLAYPLFVYKRREFMVNNTRFGTSPFELRGSVGTFFVIYLKALGLLILLLILLSFLWGLLNMLLQGSFTFPEPSPDPTEELQVPLDIYLLWLLMPVYLALLVVYAFMQARKTNYVVSNSFLTRHQLQSDLETDSLVGLYITNLLMIVLSLGLAIPWANIRLARYRLFHTLLLVNGDLDEFTATVAQDVSATGEEIADIFDFDFGF